MGGFLIAFTKRKRGLEGIYAHDRRPGQNRSEQYLIFPGDFLGFS